MKLIKIPTREFKFTYSRSSGAGGQNVNKVNSKVTLKWDIKNSKSCSEVIKNRFIKKFPKRISTDNMIIITSQRFREQTRNVADCIEKIHLLLKVVSKRVKKRVATGPTKSSIEKRIKTKKNRSQLKKDRQKKINID